MHHPTWACNLAMAANSTVLTISRVEGIAMRDSKAPIYLEFAKRILIFLMAVWGSSTSSVRADEPTDKAFSERLGQVAKRTKSNVTELVNIYKEIHSHPELSLQETRT